MPTERQNRIMQLLKSWQAESIRELSALLYVSEASVRRDVAVLEEEGMLRRLHGKILLSSNENTVVPLAVRDGDHSAQKERLARRAAALVQDGETILLDASSTVRRMIKYLSPRRELTIITNNDRIFSELGGCTARIYCTGGEYLRENHAFAGPAAERFVQSIRADRLFFSSQGLSFTGEVSDHSEPETSLRRVMLERSRQAHCLMDDSKLGRECAFRLCGREDVACFLCEQKLPWED